MFHPSYHRWYGRLAQHGLVGIAIRIGQREGWPRRLSEWSGEQRAASIREIESRLNVESFEIVRATVSEGSSHVC
jgi:hypothetical protein